MSLMVHAGANKIGQQDLLARPLPEATDTHKPIAHSRVVAGIIEGLGYRKIDVVRDEYGISKGGIACSASLSSTSNETGSAWAYRCIGQRHQPASTSPHFSRKIVHYEAPASMLGLLFVPYCAY